MKFTEKQLKELSSIAFELYMKDLITHETLIRILKELGYREYWWRRELQLIYRKEQK